MSVLSHRPAAELTYNGVPVRRRADDGFINVTDLWKAAGSPSTFRPDKWAALPENQLFLDGMSQQRGFSVWQVVRGGTDLQGTFASSEAAARYAVYLSVDCYDWVCSILDGGVQGFFKAERRTIPLGDFLLDVYKVPSGEYRLSQTQVTTAIGKPESSFREFLRSKSPEALPHKGFKAGKLPVEDSKFPINPIPIRVATAYWTKEAIAQGNQVAIRFLGACAVENIERRADKAFGIHKAEQEYNQVFKSALDSLTEFFPSFSQLATPDPIGSSRISMVLAEKAELTKLRRKHDKEIFRHPKKSVIRDLVVLGASAQWFLAPEIPVPYPKGAANRNCYPDLMTQKIECVVGDHTERVILLFQYVNSIVTERHIREGFYLREYVGRVKESEKVEHAFLFFVSPYGVTRFAEAEIRERSELNSCIGVLTVKQLAKFFVDRALEGKSSFRKADIKKQYQHLTDYKTLDEFFAQEEQDNLSSQSKVLPTAMEQLSLFDLFAAS